MVYFAALLIVLTAVAHSFLGERYLLVRLFRMELPKLLGGTEFTKGTLRFAWHLTTIVWFGFAYLLVLVAGQKLDRTSVLQLVSVTSFVSGLFPLIFTRGKHLSWIVLFAVAVITWLV